jgi:hypothetical protein
MDFAESSTKIKEDMRMYLDAKYDREFEIQHFMRGTEFLADNRYDEGIAAPLDDPDARFSVLRHGDGSDSKFEDGFAYVLAEEAASPIGEKLVHAAFGSQLAWSIEISSGDQMSDYVPNGHFSLSDFFEEGRTGGDFVRVNIAVPTSASRQREDEERELANLIKSLWGQGLRPATLRVDLYRLGDEDFARVAETGDTSNALGLADSYYAVWIDPFDERALERLPEIIEGGRHE